MDRIFFQNSFKVLMVCKSLKSYITRNSDLFKKKLINQVLLMHQYLLPIESAAYFVIILASSANMKQLQLRWTDTEHSPNRFLMITHTEHHLSMYTNTSKLTNAEKITLYVKHYMFLAIKRTHRGMDLSLIKLQHAESSDWDHDFFKKYTSLL